MSRDVPIEDNFSKTVFADNVKLKLTVDYYIELSKHDIKEKIDQKQIQNFSIELKNQYHSEMPVAEINKQLTEIFEYIATGTSTKEVLELMGMILKECLLYNQNPLVTKETKKEPRTSINITFLIIGILIVCIILLAAFGNSLSNSNHDEYNSGTDISTSIEPTTTITTTQNSKPLPETGEILIKTNLSCDSQITIQNSSSNCFVKLKDSNYNDVFGFFVRANDTITIDVPMGYYYVYFASGDKWYGITELFGDETNCSKDEDIQDFNNYSITYTLYNVNYGNFNPKYISEEEF